MPGFKEIRTIRCWLQYHVTCIIKTRYMVKNCTIIEKSIWIIVKISGFILVQWDKVQSRIEEENDLPQDAY